MADMELIALALAAVVAAVVIWQARVAARDPRPMTDEEQAEEAEWAWRIR